MAYTRWIDSNWYSFYNSIGKDTVADEQCLSLWHVTETKTFTYKQLLTMGEGKLRSIYPEADDSDITEALDIISRFKKDVEDDFKADDLK